jgi:hypothetical protein
MQHERRQTIVKMKFKGSSLLWNIMARAPKSWRPAILHRRYLTFSAQLLFILHSLPRPPQISLYIKGTHDLNRVVFFLLASKASYSTPDEAYITSKSRLHPPHDLQVR